MVVILKVCCYKILTMKGNVICLLNENKDRTLLPSLIGDKDKEKRQNSMRKAKLFV
jgi:hypothetical protein